MASSEVNKGVQRYLVKQIEAKTNNKQLRASTVKEEAVPCNDTLSTAGEAEILAALWPAYNLVFPTVLATGVAGNLMNLLVLTRPTLRGVTYVYLTGLAIADLGVMIAAIPAVLRFNNHHSLPYYAAFYHSYIELVVTHTLMAASVFIVCFMTFDRFFSVCRPSEFKSFHTRRNSILAITVSYILGFLLSCPLAGLRMPCMSGYIETNITFSYKENREVTRSTAWMLYLWLCEPCTRILPAIILAVLNCLIISSFRGLARHQRKIRQGMKFRKRLDTTERQNVVRYRLYLEEQRLVHLLTAIIITFFITMTPATVLSLIYTDHLDDHFLFQVFRAIANMFEVANFALNFFIYCLCSKQFRQAMFSLFKNEVKVRDDGIELDTTRNGTSRSVSR